jgi:hypothetical protein
MYRYWLRDFEEHAEARAHEERPSGTAVLTPALIRSIQRFQAGEDGDGASLIAKSDAAGDADYAAAVRLFVAEEQQHARLLAGVLGDAGTIDGHWSDTVFVAVRRLAGLRWELMTLMLAEVVALRYYAALRDGAGDPVVRAVAGRILRDEERHVPFHTDRLRDGFARSSWLVCVVATVAWWGLMVGAAAVVAVDHGAALRAVGVPRRQFLGDVLRLFRPIAREVTRVGVVRRRAVTVPGCTGIGRISSATQPGSPASPHCGTSGSPSTRRSLPPS